MKVRVFNKTWLCLAVIIVAAAIVYSNTLDAPFVFDDHLQIAENTRIKNLDYHLSLERLTSQRPLTNLTFALNYHLHGLDVWGYHFVNLLVHILAGITVFFLALIVFRSLLQKNSPVEREYSDFQIRLMALFTALVFVVHPLQTQAVTYIVQRYTSMAAMFYLMAVLLYILARQGQIRGLSPARYVLLFLLCLFSGALAFLSKQNAASLPGVIVLLEITLFKRPERFWRKGLVLFVPALAVFLSFIFYSAGLFRRKLDFGSLLEDVSSLMQETETVTRLEYLYTQFNVIPNYIKLILFPAGQNADPMRTFVASFFEGYTALGFLFILVLITMAVMVRKKFPVITLGVLWFFITLSVESSIIPIRDAMFEHRMYLPMFGPALICAWILGLASRKWAVKTVILAFVVTIGLGVLTYERNKVWSNETDLWADVIAKNPKNYRAHANLGLAHELDGKWQKALTHYNKALMIEPEFPYALLNLGGLLGKRGNHKDAEEVLKRGIRIKPGSFRIHNNLGVVLAAQGRLYEAKEHFQKALSRDRFFLAASNNLALTYYNLGQNKDALNQFSRSLEIDPNDGFALQWVDRLE